MSDDDREASGEKWVEARSWSHVDLLEFIRPAFWAMLAFMLIPRWWDNTELTLATLNGQALYMVCLLSFFLFYLFLFCLLTSWYVPFCRNDLTSLSRVPTMSTTFLLGFTNFDNGMSTCSPPFLVQTIDAYTDGAIGSPSLTPSSIA
jgi:hypothetical protein